MADEKTTTAETNVTSYKVDDATADQLERLTNFVKVMDVKRSIDFDNIDLGIENPESDLSRYLGRILINYYDHGLSYQEIGNLLEIVKKYNEAISSRQNDIAEFLGFGKNTPIRNSLAYHLALYLERNVDESNPEDSYIHYEYYDNSTDSYSYENVAFLDYEDQIIAASVDYLLTVHTFSTTDEVETYDLSGITIDTSSEEPESYVKYMTSEAFDISSTDDKTVYKYTLEDSGSKLVIEIPKDVDELIGNAIYTLINKEKIIYQSKTDNLLKKQTNINNQTEVTFIEKTSAFTTEGALATKGELVNIFDLQFDANKLPNNGIVDDLGLSTSGNEAFSLLKKNVGNSPKMVRVLIVYKELNPAYRRLLNCELVECAINSITGVISNNESKIITTTFSEKMNSYFSTDTDSESFITPTSLSILRNEYKNNLLIGRSYSVGSNLVYATDTFRYQYGNPYTARVACESDIMKYYISDPDIINGYGKYIYEKNEINKFLDNYAQVRDYFYKVLLNESFINESEYSLYEKLFLAFWAIERTISGKVDNNMDIDSFDKEDIINFFRSYGLKGLADILDFKNFYDSEELSKRVIKHYTQLVSNKGSKKIIDVIVSVFSFKKNELEIYKDILLKNDKDEYGFVKVSYNSDNMIKDVLLGLNKLTTLETFVEDDKYWDPENTPNELLDDLLIQNVETKYITPEYRIEISERYFKIRLIFAMLDYLIDTILSKVTSNEEFQAKYPKLYSISEQIKLLREMLYLYFTSIIGVNAENLGYGNSFITFKIDDNAVGDILSDYFDNSAALNSNNIVRDFQSSIKTENRDYQVSAAEEFIRSFEFIYKVHLAKNAEDLDLNLDLDSFFNTNNIAEDEIIAAFVDTLYNTLNTYLFNGYIYKNNFDALFINKAYEIFNKIFFVSSNSIYDILVETPSSEISKYDEDAILEQVEKVKDLIGTDITLSLEADENRLVAFLNEVIKYFISYTAEAKDAQVLKRYDTLSENVIMRDRIEIRPNLYLLDSYFYDDALKINIVPLNNGGNNVG